MTHPPPDPEGRRPMLPCPFCGGDPLPRPDQVLRDGHEPDEEGPDAFAYFIRCRCCAAEGGWAKSEFGARRQWNMRAEAASFAARLDAALAVKDEREAVERAWALVRELRGEES